MEIGKILSQVELALLIACVSLFLAALVTTYCDLMWKSPPAPKLRGPDPAPPRALDPKNQEKVEQLTQDLPAIRAAAREKEQRELDAAKEHWERTRPLD